MGVRIIKIEEDQKPFRLVYDPTHPDAIKYRGKERLS
jgi:flagellar basal body rod protein FlgC